MIKIETIKMEYEYCAECSNCDERFDKNRVIVHSCMKTHRTLKEIWGKIPKWCPLEEK